MSVFAANISSSTSSTGGCAPLGRSLPSGARVQRWAGRLIPKRSLRLSSSREAGSAGVSRSALRLTRRGRLVLLGLPAMAAVLAVLVGAASWAATLPAFASEGGRGVEEVTVMSGESLWSIAEEHAPGRDPRDVVDEIVSLNGLQGSRVEAGQVLEIPVYSAP